MADSKFLIVAKKAALQAGEVIKKYYNSKLILHGKGHFANFATQADLDAEKKIIEIIKKSFPSHNIIAEESGIEDRGSEYSWAIDPVDGTIPFADGLPFFGVSIGLLKNMKPYLGVINMVAHNELFWAEEGKGAFKNGKKISVSKESKLGNCTLSLEFGHSERDMRLEKHFKPIVDRVRYVYVLGSSVYAHTLVAEGKIEALFIRAHPWDFAAGTILVKEAGGKFSDPKGEMPDFSEDKMLVITSNRLIHDELLKTYGPLNP